MELRDLIVETLSAVPQIEGRKRLQKVIHLLMIAGVEAPSDYRILHYGPFSEAVAVTADELVLEGTLKETFEPVGVYKTHQYLYQLGDKTRRQRRDARVAALLKELDKFSTVELEIASTIGFFEDQGMSRDLAIKRTEYMKPTKAIRPVIEKATALLGKLRNPRKPATAAARRAVR